MTFVESEYWDIQSMLHVPNCTGTVPQNTTSSLEATLWKIHHQRIATGSDFNPKTGLLFCAEAHEPRSTVKGIVQDGDGDENGSSTVCHLTKEKIDQLMSWIQSTSTRSHQQNSPRWTVKSIERKERSYSPPLPFTTSTLQQEANKRLGLSVADTMKCAQMLYEAGLISYMRTDSNYLSEDATNAAKNGVLNTFGSHYLNNDNGKVNSRRMKKGGQGLKQAQEAHEAIRPSVQSDGSFISPPDVSSHYTDETNGHTMTESLLQLYQLIYERTLSSFMKNQLIEQTTILIDCATETEIATFRASGSVILFDGFTKMTSREPQTHQTILPIGLVEGQELECQQVIPRLHKTKPPPRYSEASFVKDLEMLGVGRPSTYASIVQTLKSRFYVGTAVDSESYSSRRSALPIRGSAISASRAAGGLGNKIL
jgi:DNA topoisomerase-1